MKLVILFMIQLYRTLLSPLKMGPSCRYQPTCSEYALEAVRKYGTARGLGLALRRLLRCHPFSKGGYDPVP
ncbi:MAG: membrane protein insertion efficiency factor YidD [Firmicutes bacterium]|nr:membrane protein insertion efficiency factor YidD [Bacillota bacterium]